MMKKILMVALAVMGFGAFADNFIERYRGPLIGNEAHPRKVFEKLDLSQYEVRAAANGTYDKYKGVYTICAGAARIAYFPISQSYSAEKKRLRVKMQNYYLYTGNAAYQTLQMNIVLEEREDGIYAWCDDMCQSNIVGAEGVWMPYVWGVWSNIPVDYAPLGSKNRFANADYGYDWEDIDGTFKKGFGIDNILLGKKNVPETEITDLSPSEIAIDGNCVIEDPGSVTFAANLSGEGELTYRATTPVVAEADTVAVGEDVALDTNWRRVATGRLLSKLTSVSAMTCGTRAGSHVPGGYAHWRNNGGLCVVQIYTPWSQYYQTGVILYLRQVGPDIWATITPRSFTKPGENGHPQAGYVYGEIDFEKDYAADPSKFQSVQPSQVSICDLMLNFDAGSAMQVVDSTGLNTMSTGSVVRVTGTASAPMGVYFDTKTDNRGTPVYGGVEVGAGGNVFVGKAVSPWWFYAHDGGAIYQASNQCFQAANANIRLNAGKLYVGYQVMTGSREDFDDAYTYVNNLRLENGSEIVGRSPRIGPSGTASPLWKVAGSSPSTANCGLMLLSAKSDESQMVLDVDDVTDSAAVDFTVKGPIAFHKDSTGPMYLIKTGDGTLALTAATTANLTKLEVRGGTWRYGCAEAANANTPVHLYGGNLEVARGVTVAVASLESESTATVTLEAGAKLSAGYVFEFGDEMPGTIDFRGEGALDPLAIRIGEGALEPEKLARVKIYGRPVTQDENGYLVSDIKPLTLLLR